MLRYVRATVVLSDFWKKLAVISKGKKSDEIQSCLKYSRLWQQVKTIKQKQI